VWALTLGCLAKAPATTQQGAAGLEGPLAGVEEVVAAAAAEVILLLLCAQVNALTEWLTGMILCVMLEAHTCNGVRKPASRDGQY
jgi:hypothetical protein